MFPLLVSIWICYFHNSFLFAVSSPRSKFSFFLLIQVFCVGLWCLDEYWYYSLFTLFMLFMFESTMAKSRLKTLSELRRVRVDSQTLMVYRCGKYVCQYFIHLPKFCIVFSNIYWFFWLLKLLDYRWVKLSGTDLLPGDVVSIGRSSGPNGEDKSVPADMLLLAGSAIVNEAILTGESTPQWKVFFSFPFSNSVHVVVFSSGK